MKNGTHVGRESYGPRSMAAVPIAQWVVPREQAISIV
jgi:hypothetical protein